MCSSGKGGPDGSTHQSPCCWREDPTTLFSRRGLGLRVCGGEHGPGGEGGGWRWDGGCGGTWQMAWIRAQIPAPYSLRIVSLSASFLRASISPRPRNLVHFRFFFNGDPKQLHSAARWRHDFSQDLAWLWPLPTPVKRHPRSCPPPACSMQLSITCPFPTNPARM